MKRADVIFKQNKNKKYREDVKLSFCAGVGVLSKHSFHRVNWAPDGLVMLADVHNQHKTCGVLSMGWTKGHGGFVTSGQNLSESVMLSFLSCFFIFKKCFNRQ